ncbi:MAG TPA: phosphatase PAP2 family protein [Terracidiphilus sp.]
MFKTRIHCALCALVLVVLCPAWNAQVASSGTSKPPRVAYYVDTAVLNVQALVADPPAVGSAANKAELATLHGIEAARTSQLAASAKADEDEEDMFAFKSVLGSQFTPELLPLTAELGTHVKNEQSVVGGLLKRNFQRPRPYQTDSTLHPICALKSAHDSYPSGHALTGYLEALTLAELFPDKRNAILERADEYARNRLVCGVHYPSDIEASRRVAYAVFGFMLSSPKFQHDLEASRAEIHAKSLPTGK